MRAHANRLAVFSKYPNKIRVSEKNIVIPAASTVHVKSMAEEQYGQYASPEQQGFYESGFTLEDQAEPSQQQQWSQGPSSYYSAPPPPPVPHQQHVYSAEGYGQQSKTLLANKLHVCVLSNITVQQMV